MQRIGLLTTELTDSLPGHAILSWGRSGSPGHSAANWTPAGGTTSEWIVVPEWFGNSPGDPMVSAGVGYRFGAHRSAILANAAPFERLRVRPWRLGAKPER